jgi:RHH-type rel operon transcriptional repressor/antitoxin RelB
MAPQVDRRPNEAAGEALESETMRCYTCIAGGHPMLAVRLSPDIEKRLDELSKKTGRTKTYYAREAIIEYIDDLEDYYLAVDRLRSPGRRWTMEEVEKELGLAG